MSKINYEEAILRIEKIVSELEKNEVSLEESLQLYEEGMKLTAQCYQVLENTEKQSIKILEETAIKKLKEQVENEGN